MSQWYEEHKVNRLILNSDFRTNYYVRDDHNLFVFSPGTFKSMTKRSHSRLKFTREQFWYKLCSYKEVNPTIKISHCTLKSHLENGKMTLKVVFWVSA